jgi:hypothetical protein
MNHVIEIQIYLFTNMRKEIDTSIVQASMLLAGEFVKKNIYRAQMLAEAGSKVIYSYTYLVNPGYYLFHPLHLGMKNTKSPADTKVEWFYGKDPSKKVSVQHEKGINKMK